MKIVNCVQGTPEWHAARAGKVTASGVVNVLAKIKSGEAAARRDYRVQLVTEILTGEATEPGFQSKEMQWGNEQEPFARALYELTRDVMVDQVGFVLHDTITLAGCSPDGLVGEDGLVEIKCPKSATHLGYILANVVPTDYQAQMLWQMAVTRRAWCDFVSYDPRMPEHLQLFVIRFHRDEARIEAMTAEVLAFLAEVRAMLDSLESVNPVQALEAPQAEAKPAPKRTRAAVATAVVTDPGALERQPHGADAGGGEDPLPL